MCLESAAKFAERNGDTRVTQRTWKTIDGWEVLTGWDRQLQHYFLQISRACTNCGGDGSVIRDYAEQECGACEARGQEFLFSNLDDKTGMTDIHGGMSQSQIVLVLEKYLTDWPDQVIAVLGNDRHNNLGNDQHDFGSGIGVRA